MKVNYSLCKETFCWCWRIRIHLKLHYFAIYDKKHCTSRNWFYIYALRRGLYFTNVLIKCHLWEEDNIHRLLKIWRGPPNKLASWLHTEEVNIGCWRFEGALQINKLASWLHTERNSWQNIAPSFFISQWNSVTTQLFLKWQLKKTLKAITLKNAATD